MSIKLSIDRAISVGHHEDSIEMEVIGNTIGDSLDNVIRQYPTIKEALFDEKGELHDYILLIVNGHWVTVNVTDRKVADGDRIEVIRFEGR